MPHTIQNIAVIGSGVMGSQIAAHCANAGYAVLLLDIVPEGVKDKNQLAKNAIARMKEMDPAPFMHKDAVARVRPGNLQDNLADLAGMDWIIEAVLENPQIKSDLYRKIDAVRKKGSVVSSNTSTIPLAVLLKEQAPDFAKDFLITHFFNPPRYMRLLELVTSPQTDPQHIATIRAFCDQKLGKGVVLCKDTPGFIANRIGTYWIERAVFAAMDLGVRVEEADAVLGKPLKMPKTGVFGLIDLIGLDLMPLIAKSLLATLPAEDAFRSLHREPPLFTKMISEGYTGRKGKGGFYRINREGGGKVKEALNLKDGSYAPAAEVALPQLAAAAKNLRVLCETPDKIGQFAWTVLRDGLVYAASLVPQIADSIVAVDEAMRFGYNWGEGPFELIDRLGVDWFIGKLQQDGIAVPPLLAQAAGKSFYTTEGGVLQQLTVAGHYAPVPRGEGVLLLADIKRKTTKPLLKNGSASLWDGGDGVVVAEIHTKMNTIDPDVFSLFQQAVDLVQHSKGVYKALVVHNEGSVFSAGANLGLALFALNIAAYETVEQFIAEGQKTWRLLRDAPFPVVAAAHNLALGGGCELLLHCDAVVAHAELYTGLVEVGVGVIPGWGGCTQLLGRASHDSHQRKGPMPALGFAFEQIAMAKVSKSAFEARDMLYLRDGAHRITLNSDRLLADAKAYALELAQAYKPPTPYTYRLPGTTGKAALSLAVAALKALGKVTPHDEVVLEALMTVLSGGDTNLIKTLDETALYQLEAAAFTRLIRHPASVARIEHMLETGKPLRN